MKTKIFILLTGILISCQSSSQTNLLKVADFNQKSTAADAHIIDVRTPEEYKEGFIKGAVNIDYNGSDFDSEVAKLDKSQTYFLYCLSGHRSGEALAKMTSSGFKSVYSLDGGIKAWKSEKMPVEMPSEKKDTTTQITSPETKDPTDFKTAIFGDKLVFVDFNATWCGPCKRMQPFVDMIKEERSKEVIVFSIDTDEQAQLAQEYQIYNLPTVILIKKGAVLYRAEGYQDQQSLNALVTKYK